MNEDLKGKSSNKTGTESIYNTLSYSSLISYKYHNPQGLTPEGFELLGNVVGCHTLQSLSQQPCIGYNQASSRPKNTNTFHTQFDHIPDLLHLATTVCVIGFFIQKSLKICLHTFFMP